MERKQKTYQSVHYVQLDTYLKVKGQRTLIEFRGGTLEPKRNGTYNCTDPDVIEALDANIKRIGPRCSYKCIHEEILLEDDSPKKKTGNAVIRDVPAINTVTAGREWLINASISGQIEEGITPSMIKNRTDVLRIAEENGIRFIDLPVN